MEGGIGFGERDRISEICGRIANRSEEAREECSMRTLGGIVNGCHGCGGCCGRVIPMTEREARALSDYVAENSIVPAKNEWDYCSLLDLESGLCKAYEARPLICRLWTSPSRARVIAADGTACGPKVEDVGLMTGLVANAMVFDTWELFDVEEEK